MKNNLSELNNYLFEQLERLNDDELMNENADKEISRSKAITNVAQTIINNGALALNAKKYVDDYGDGKTNNLPDLLRIETK
jgi:hypothetical protein